LAPSNDNEIAANTKYRGIPLLPYVNMSSNNTSNRTVSKVAPLEGTRVDGHPDDSVTSMCQIVPAFNGISSASKLKLNEKNNVTRICTLTPMGKCVSIVDVEGNPGSTMHTGLVANVSMQTPDRIQCCCQCDNTGLVAVSTDGNDLFFFIGSSNWNANITRKKPEQFPIRYKITNLTYSPCVMHFYTGTLPTPKQSSGVSTRNKDLMIFGGEKGEVSLMVCTNKFRQEVIKFTKTTATWPPGKRVKPIYILFDNFFH